MMRIMYLAIDSLNKEDRFIILSFYNHEKSIREISEICRMSESNVKVKLHRIKKRLSVLIGDKIDLCYG
jgi:RNA polymerase sigma-70 factor (ECF subfamily)